MMNNPEMIVALTSSAKFVLLTFVIGVGAIAALAGLYVTSVKVQARLEVKSQPRAPMYECPNGHPPMLEKHLIHHLGQTMCPLCWNERVKTKLDGTMK
jgi:disulfide bond formation protein DsbB